MAKRKKTTKPAASIEAIKHKDKRANIPTEELRDFVAEDEAAPQTMLYPRDPSLDPQLVWKGKDQQDAADLAVPVVPVYIQEKIHPRAIVDDLLAEARRRERLETGPTEQQLDLFADFNGLEDAFDKKVEFYQHEQSWTNRMILGDSLMVMTSLAEKEGLKGKVQCVYLDPPYGIKFASNWQVSTRKRDVKDGKVEDATREPEQIRAFRDTWKLGIHSYLAYLRDRLVVARGLLTETGSLFVQIGDENVHMLRCILDEVFGPENFCGLIAFRTTGGQSSALISSSTDYLLWYAKRRVEQGKLIVKYRQPLREKVGGPADASGQYTMVEAADGWSGPRQMTKDELAGALSGDYRILAHDTLYSQGDPSDPEEKDFEWQGQRFRCPPNTHWKASVKGGGMARLAAADRLMLLGRTLRYKRYVDDYPAYEIDNVWNDTAISGFARKKAYVVETSTKVIERCILMTTDPGDLVLDPTCGSGTTAYVAEQWGRRWITIDTSRVALALARTRIMAARYPYYLLADSPEGIEKDAEISGTGILPVKKHRQDAEATSGMGFQPMKELEVVKRQGAYLPHWTGAGATYSVTFRLADSLPQAVLEAFMREREEILQHTATAGRALGAEEQQRLRELFSDRIERFLDAGHGECVLRDDRVAAVVRDALAHFDGQRYDVLAWCVMPNHAHVVVRPCPGHELSAILHSWKSFTATQINRLLGRSGILWQPEYFDHLIRDADDAERSVAYVVQNPDSAGLKNWKWCGMGFQRMMQAQDEPAAGHRQDTHASSHGQDARATEGDIRKGFVYRRVPHVTLKSIANNPDIKDGLSRAEIDAAIARHADQEILYDQPYVDNKRVRVSGPFTVESLSPHRVLPAADDNFDGTVSEQEARKQQDFAQMILENLRKAGVQNTRKNERLKFDTLEPLAGRWLHAAGEYADADGNVRRVAVSLGPEHGTVGPSQVKEAAKEAVQGVGYDVLIVCGFAFDPHVSEEAKRYGKLTVLPTKMNPDLAMGDELLKKTGAGNLFMVFGEPDVEIRRVAAPDDGEAAWLEAEIKGVDVYDPTTGAIRSSSTDDIACWFIDTSYNGESFFVRQAYFTGAEEPYQKLKRALRAEIDEEAWSSLYGTTSRPFPAPETGKIAIKVINHYGDEVLKVFEV